MRRRVGYDPAPVTVAPLIDSFRHAAEAVGAQVEILGAHQLVIRLRELAMSTGGVSFASRLRVLLDDALDDVPDDIEPESVFGLARGAVARTGTVIVAEEHRGDRLAHMLARRHVVVIPADLIVLDLQDSSNILAETLACGATYVTYVTGPSRTSDIENVLTIGAHGPYALILLVVVDEDRDAD